MIHYRTLRSRVARKSCEWVPEKRELCRHQGKEVRPNTQYSGHKHKPRF